MCIGISIEFRISFKSILISVGKKILFGVLPIIFRYLVYSSSKKINEKCHYLSIENVPEQPSPSTVFAACVYECYNKLVFQVCAQYCTYSDSFNCLFWFVYFFTLSKYTYQWPLLTRVDLDVVKGNCIGKFVVVQVRIIVIMSWDRP